MIAPLHFSRGSSDNHFDVAVIGAGPGGALAALLLARAGRSVVLMDRAAFPRHKVCGDCMNPSINRIWERLGLIDSYEQLPAHQITSLTVFCEETAILHHPFDSRTPGPRAVARQVLDSWLVAHAVAAGARFLPETIIESLDAETGSLRTNRGAFTAERLIGADGRNSFVAKQAGLSAPTQRCPRIAFQTTLEIGRDLAEDATDGIHMRIFPEGYYGFCRIDSTHANLCSILHADHAAEAHAILSRYFPSLPPREWNRVNPITRAHALHGRARLFLIGDAARVVEPFTGEGIYFALATAELAVNAILESRTLADYAKQHRALYKNRAWVNTLVRTALLDPRRTTRLGKWLRFTPAPLAFLSRQVHAAVAA